MTALLPLSILGVGGVRWIPLETTCTPIYVAVSVVDSFYTSMATVSVTMGSTVLIQYFNVDPLTALPVEYASALHPLSWCDHLYE